ARAASASAGGVLRWLEERELEIDLLRERRIRERAPEERRDALGGLRKFVREEITVGEDESGRRERLAMARAELRVVGDDEAERVLGGERHVSSVMDDR